MAAFSRKQLLLMGGLLLSVGLSAWTYWQERDVEAETRESSTASAAASVVNIAQAPIAGASMSDGAAVVLGESADAPPPVPLPLGLVARSRAPVTLDPFAPLAVIEPPKPKTPEPPKVVEVPKAPPLPFQYMGKWVDSESSVNSGGASSPTTPKKIVVYLVRGNEMFSVSPGDAIDARYQFVGFEGETLVFKYIPLSERQTLATGQMP
ncbi:hypothetical protein [Limnohabitans sp.]|uniref:hypothetical protein n=1 Tax=Limnohabitans sp. TaxID=1907725 RepID=UPI00286FA7FF|nr:hypothetical protein [Limnohabitans sp.]